MKLYFTFLLVLFLSCQKSSKTEDTLSAQDNATSQANKDSTTQSMQQDIIESEKRFLDSLYNRESIKFISVLEEIPNRDTDAYKLTITSKDGKSKIVKILDVRPKMSKISYCNDLYTVVGFPCGGPCYSRVFVFTDKDRPTEQYSYSQEVKNNPNLITHIQDEEFGKLIIHNFSNSKELTVDISDANSQIYGQMDSMVVQKDNLVLYYLSGKNKNRVKKNKSEIHTVT
ncbi:hypothetical protein NAT51_15270 [Flavobacterium amniphilum]|uniref:hypothetical protein n=1 Tax=Flavobacterium amniphilum TaxID=1834035 RepID=UPI00202A6D17|nr:hypothetical protein [Flavobacterium amniphilum]MCL9806895.1 hypothetical protein [Flavobacterium amniphilum]